MKAVDLTKFAKEYTKKSGIQVGFHDATIFADTSNYVLNKIISSKFRGGIPIDGRITCVAGASGSGKSFLGVTVAKWCLEHEMQVVFLDSENGIDTTFLKGLDVDPNNPALMRIPVATPEDVAGIISDFMKEYRANYDKVPFEERPKVLFVLDSIGMLQTTADTEQFDKGDLRGTYGQKAKQLRMLVANALRLFSNQPVGMFAVSHTSESMDMFKPGQVVSGGQGFVYASSVVLILSKLILKENEDGEKTSEVVGIRSRAMCSKSRYARPHGQVDVSITWSNGLLRYSGLVGFFEAKGFLVKSGNRLEWTSPSTGEVIKLYRKEFIRNKELLERMMDEFEAVEDQTAVTGIGADIQAFEEGEGEVSDE